MPRGPDTTGGPRMKLARLATLVTFALAAHAAPLAAGGQRSAGVRKVLHKPLLGTAIVSAIRKVLAP
jgi:hypothetical protein